MIRSHTPPSVLHQVGGFEWIVFMVVFLVMLGVTVRLHPESRDDRTAMRTMLGRGLAAAALASLPFAIASTDPGNPDYATNHNAMAGFEVRS